MKLQTNSNSLAGQIETIITEAESKLVLISPYIQLEKDDEIQWSNIKKALKYALQKQGKIQIELYTRTPSKQNNQYIQDILREFTSPQFKVYLIDNLHTKLYYNEHEALITSMNMYLHSALNNFEIGVLFEKTDTEEMNKIRKYINRLHAEAEQYQTEEQVTQSQKQHQEEDNGDDFRDMQFQVLSKGYKWIKVKTAEGYENKVSIDYTDELTTNKHYTAKGKINWNRTPFGFDVELINLHEITEIEAFCIVCRKPVQKQYTYCFDCNTKRNDDTITLEPKYCHRCGTEDVSIDETKKLCKSCFISSKGEKEPGDAPAAGVCIMCGSSIDFDPNLKFVRCKDCWKQNKRAKELEGEFCHRCGDNKAKISLQKPVCYTCYKKMK